MDTTLKEEEVRRVAPLFDGGRLLSTPAAVGAFSPQQMAAALSRHFSGDWSDCDPYDAQANRDALTSGGRLFGVYRVEGAASPMWIITEADRSVTTILLPEDY